MCFSGVMCVCCGICFGFSFIWGRVCTGVLERCFCGDLERGVVLNSGSDFLLEGGSIYICVEKVDVFTLEGFGEVTVSAMLSYINESELPEDIFVYLSTYRVYCFRLKYAGGGFYAFTQKNVSFVLDGYGEFYPFDSYNERWRLRLFFMGWFMILM